jgi:hypothetical protein
MKQTNYKKIIAVGLTLALLATPLSLFAGNGTKTIRAKLAQKVTYSVNNKQVAQDSTAIIYKDQTYVPIEVLAEALGYTPTVKDSQIAFTSKTPTNTKPVPTPPVAPAPTPTQTIADARILAIDFGANTIVVAPSQTQTDKAINQVKLTITPQTQLIDTKTNASTPLQNLTTGQTVSVVYTPITAATNQAAATGTAVSITVLYPTPIQPR